MARRNTSLYLGFGGSGSKTLAEFAELVAFHQEMGSRSESNFAFLLFDTFRDDLRKGEARIRAAFEKAGSSPIVKTFCISQDYPTFNTKAGPRLQNAFLADTGRRLDQFWWSRDAKGRRTPFTAVRFPHSPEIGAGQAPLISTFLTWHWLDAPGNSIRDMIRDTVNELKLRNTAAGHGQDLGLETTVIAGLAGGTGRGCWHLLSLIVSQILKDEGQTNHPIGLFYDASAFPEILSQRPEWKMKMTVNSLTGFSELVGFRRNELEKIDDCYHMSLPSLTRPSEEKADIINTVDLVGRDTAGNPVSTSGYGPVSRAFVVFGAGRAGSPGESSLYFKVGANVLYTRFIEQLQGQGANTNEFGSVGCASFVVPISKVVDYAKRAVSLVAADRLIKGTDSDDNLNRVVEWFARRVNIGDFGGEVDSNASHALGRVSSRYRSFIDDRVESIVKDSDGKRRDQLHELKTVYPNSDRGQQDIRSWVTDDITKWLWETAPHSNGKGGSLRDATTTPAPELDESAVPAAALGKPAFNAIALAVERIVAADAVATDAKGSIDLRCYGTKLAITARIRAWLEEEAERIGKLPADSDQNQGLETYDKAVSGYVASTITQEEWDAIRRDVWEGSLAQIRDTMREAIKTLLKNAANELGTLVHRIDTVIKTITEQNQKEKKELAERARETFWGDEDFERIIASGAGEVAYSTSILAETEIKPVITVTRKSLEDKVDAAIQECDKSPRRDGRGLKGALEDVRRHATAILRRPVFGTDGADGLSAALKKSISEIGKQIELGQDFYRGHFSFTGVVRQHLVAWHHKWHELAHAPVTRAKIEREFQMLFGTKLPDAIRDEGFASTPGDIEKAVRAVCLQMAVQIGHRCDVLATQLADDSYAIDRAAVVLPADAVFGEEFKKECEKEANSGDRLFKDNGFTVITTFDESGDTVGDPYSMLGYASEDFNLGPIDDDRPLERIKSLTRQYEGNPDILAWLEACEDPEGSSVFVDGSSSLKEADKCFGLGYSFPFMVKEERMRRCRWRPWARQAEARRERERDKELVGDALLFALLEPAKSDSPPPEASLAWSMPLVSLPAIPHFNAAWALTRPAYRQTSGEQAPMPTHPSTPEGLSFDGILDVFKNLKDQTKGYVNAIAGEAAIYFGRILPEADTKLTPDIVTKRLFDGLQERLKTFAADMSGDQEDMKERSRKELAKLILRCGELRGMTCAELADHFARRS